MGRRQNKAYMNGLEWNITKSYETLNGIAEFVATIVIIPSLVAH